MIERLELKNFTAFRDLKIDFSPKINVFIGENGTGKTHLLKAVYALCSTPDKSMNVTADVSNEDIQKAITGKLVEIFLPLENKIAKLRQTGSDGSAEVKFISSNSHELSFSFYTNSQQIKVIDNKRYERYSYVPLFIPTKEMLSFLEGFGSLYKKFHLSFDMTYSDLYDFLNLPLARKDQLDAKVKWAMEEIEKIIQGKFIFHGGGRVTFQSATEEYSINTTAEGFRKFGTLYRLLETGTLIPFVSGPLLWDEPEANMNPILLKSLVEILLELARNNQQIIIATHEFVLLKWLGLLSDNDKEQHVVYHALYRDKDSGEIKIESTDDYRQLNNNAIATSYNELTKEQVRISMGGLGK